MHVTDAFIFNWYDSNTIQWSIKPSTVSQKAKLHIILLDPKPPTYYWKRKNGAQQNTISRFWGFSWIPFYIDSPPSLLVTAWKLKHVGKNKFKSNMSCVDYISACKSRNGHQSTSNLTNLFCLIEVIRFRNRSSDGRGLAGRAAHIYYNVLFLVNMREKYNKGNSMKNLFATVSSSPFFESVDNIDFLICCVSEVWTCNEWISQWHRFSRHLGVHIPKLILS